MRELNTRARVCRNGKKKKKKGREEKKQDVKERRRRRGKRKGKFYFRYFRSLLPRASRCRL